MVELKLVLCRVAMTKEKFILTSSLEGLSMIMVCLFSFLGPKVRISIIMMVELQLALPGVGTTKEKFILTSLLVGRPSHNSQDQVKLAL